MNDYNDGTGTSPAELSCLDNLEDLAAIGTHLRQSSGLIARLQVPKLI